MALDMKEIMAYIVFKDGSGQIASYKLESGLSFVKSEMKQWIREQSKKSIKTITFISNKSMQPTAKGGG